MAYISTQEVKEMRQAIKASLPECKFSIRKEHHSTINVNILKAPVEYDRSEDLSTRLNQFDEDDKEYKKLVDFVDSIICTIKMPKDRNAGDMYADYCDYNFYHYVEMGKWDKDFEQTEGKLDLTKAQARFKKWLIKRELAK